MSHPTTPSRVEYTGPERWVVWTDEDGVHLRSPKGDSLESGEVQRLIALIEEANKQREAGTIPAPRAPSPEERRTFYGLDREEYDAKRASRAVYDALSPNTDQPAF